VVKYNRQGEQQLAPRRKKKHAHTQRAPRRHNNVFGKKPAHRRALHTKQSHSRARGIIFTDGRKGNITQQEYYQEGYNSSRHLPPKEGRVRFVLLAGFQLRFRTVGVHTGTNAAPDFYYTTYQYGGTTTLQKRVGTTQGSVSRMYGCSQETRNSHTTGTKIKGENNTKTRRPRACAQQTLLITRMRTLLLLPLATRLVTI